MTIKDPASVCVALFAVLRFALPILSQPPSGPNPANRMLVINIKDQDFHGVLGAVSVGNKVPMGVQRTALKEPGECSHLRAVDFKRAPLTAFMDLFVPTCSVYKWESVGGVISIVPVAAERSILDLPVPVFKAEGKSPREIVNLLFEGPQVKKKMKALKLTRDTSSEAFVPLTVAELGKYSVDLQNKTVRQILNHVVETTYIKYWSFEGPYSGENSIMIKMF